MATRGRRAGGNQRGMNGVPFGWGTLLGVAAYLVGYVVTMVVVIGNESDSFTEDLIQNVGWVYYNAQFADIKFSLSSGAGFGLSESTTLNFVTSSGGLFSPLETPAFIYHLIPIVSLIVFGIAVATLARAQTVQEGTLAGLTLTAGVLPLALVGVFVFSVSSGGISGRPVLTESLIFVGLLFPLVCGGIGGAIGGVAGS